MYLLPNTNWVVVEFLGNIFKVETIKNFKIKHN